MRMTATQYYKVLMDGQRPHMAQRNDGPGSVVEETE